MPNTKTKKTTTKSEPKTETTATKLLKLRTEYLKVRLDIKAGKIKNTNAHKSIKKQIAALLTNSTKA